MAKVKRFRDRRETNTVSGSADDRHGHKSPTPTETGSQDVATGENVLDSTLTQPSSQPPRYRIQVPGIEDLMARAQAGTKSHLPLTPALIASLQQPLVYVTYRPTPRLVLDPITGLFRPYPDHATGLSVAKPSSFRSAPISRPCDTTPNPHSPTGIELAGYAGLEEVPILQEIIEHTETNNVFTSFFRYNDINCPAAILLIDPLLGKGKEAEAECNRCNSGREAWLYVKARGDVKWIRDHTAERGGMRHIVHLSRCEEGWRWEQQLGDMLDCRKALNLWIQVKT